MKTDNVIINKSKKIYNLEFLRFVFIICIILGHFMSPKRGLWVSFPDIQIYEDIHRTINSTWLGVEYFFIIAGFLLVYTFKNISVSQFIKKKAVRLLPSVIGMLVFTFVIGLFIPGIKVNIYNAIVTCLFLNNLGIIPNQYTWFISPLFFSLLLYFYLLKYYKKENINLAIAIIVFSSYLLIANSNCWWDAFYNYKGIFNIGLLRALGGVGLGYFVATFYFNNIEGFKCCAKNLFTKLLFTMAECFLLFFIIYYSIFHTFRHTRFIFLFMFIALLLLFIARKGWMSQVLDNRVSNFIGKYVYSIFVMDQINQMFWFQKLHQMSEFAHNNPLLLLFICILTNIILGILVYHLFEKPVSAHFAKGK